jgi:hypothetical protein
MVWHEAVRKNIKITCLGSLHDLQPNAAHEIVFGEAIPTRKSAQRKEVTMTADVRKIRETSRAHDRASADHAPTFAV